MRIFLIAFIGAIFIFGAIGYIYFEDLSRVCLQAFFWAKNTKTGQCKYFPSSCIPRGWEFTSGGECRKDECFIDSDCGLEKKCKQEKCTIPKDYCPGMDNSFCQEMTCPLKCI
ncbi:hypothetical protein A3B42_03920 [Candidatus Daviesbacteria bacterium RIFCSPLOWO2_01_FULL_38_10]|nr:MAG: hypothetical protein A3D02_03980 [Candidatus Daviesbacteria bacterium RIFCSPHIGHO2_02_FULL_39_41]OGE38412.1 MAG: hypothetical protein A3B42_03920 [Candidatus Daviesbacteria bacterium RIFCSPLOWO2_01_FULL_38_10]OGE45528.1 MAG: hypothetical protein A3E67_00105 [Candidatus Daviesbacteria bacterium RIFCSPHIGHO2_12_FULL_38_25]OGE68826.1 MAG: hypothetical protein A3H81_04565 [Candidatus Daviesbacteria bacterium RIFCSPLOWO2_02_FULL_38_18]OGE73255.1 MAG: hypothetical protein A3H18_04915 [Candida